MRTLCKLGTLVFISTLIGSAVAAPVMATDPKGSAKPTEVRPGKGSARTGQVAPASLPIGSDIGDPNAGPLTHIGIGTDLSCAVNHRDDGQVGEFYGDTACGTFLALNGVLYGPPNIPAGGSAQPLTPWTQVSQTTSGDGSGGNPKKVTTAVTAGATGVHVIEEDRYSFGQESFSTLVRVENRGTAFADFTLYRAADCYLGNDDRGFGHSDLNGIGTTVQCVASKIQPDGSRQDS